MDNDTFHLWYFIIKAYRLIPYNGYAIELNFYSDSRVTRPSYLFVVENIEKLVMGNN